MGFFNKIFGGGTEVKKETSADQIVKMIKEKTTVGYMKLIPVKGEAKPWNSKIGGMPYMPRGFEYPLDETDLTVVVEGQQPAIKPEATAGVFAGVGGDSPVVSVAKPEVTSGQEATSQPDEIEGQAGKVEEREKMPLRFLAQLNFSEMPPLEGFPTKGILQFYISGEGSYGLNFEDRVGQHGFRVIYHEEVMEDESALLSTLPTDAVDWEDAFPVEDELRLTFEKSTMPVMAGDYRFDKILLEAYNEVHADSPVPSLDRIPEDNLDDVYDRLETGGHRVGGYPIFTQLDPREYHEDLKGHTVLLFQLDSEDCDDYSILWGDSGVCNFFIRPEDLAKRDFSKVLYNWDCY